MELYEKDTGNMILVGLLLIILSAAGEILCVIKATRCDWEAPYKAEAVYTISALTGLGSIVGWFNISDGAGK